MPENVTPKLKFVISHRKCADGKCERDHCMAVKEVLEDKGIEYVDWEFNRLHIQKESDIIEYGRNCDGVIFLIEGQMGERQEAGYDDILARKANGTPAPEMFIYVFTGKNNESSKELLGYLDSKGVVYDEFTSRYELKGHLSDVLKKRFPSKVPRWPLWVKILLPTAVAAILAILLAPLYRPWLNRLKDGGSGRAEIVELPADVAIVDDSTKANIPSLQEEPGTRVDNHNKNGSKNGPTIPAEATIIYLQNGYALTGISGVFENYILTQIESTSDLRRAPGKQVQWGISLTETKYERGVDDGDYFVDLSVSVSITNNKTGLAIPQLPLYKNECIGSPISYEEAFIAAASEEFAKRIANGIVNIIKNEK